MKLIDKIKNSELATRLFYIVPFVLFLSLMIFDRNNLKNTGLSGLQNWLLYAISGVLFLYQSIRNSIVGWVLVLMIYTFFLVILLKIAIGVIMLAAFAGIIGIGFWLIVLAIYLFLGYIYLKIRPIGRVI
ncbi:MAG: hypothetical protein JXL97_19865 [Bacteroidales bacterium]|nr:hypothetical protein [Bacteroidales bacterium]